MSAIHVPPHVGIIMDGNGRWAVARNQNRTRGHLEGLKAAKRIVAAARELGISYLTLYTFSTENWKRTQDEVGFLMGLVKQYLMKELDFYVQHSIRIRHAGNLDGLPSDIAQELKTVADLTRTYTGMTVILAFNYGGRDEIVRAIKKIVKDGVPEEAITESLVQSYLDNPDIPDPDLIIRTASEKRSSNFLLWESAYSEYYFSDKLWPDWDREDLVAAIEDYSKRQRRFGGL
ncbi:polyprenyl diphosphate synthase [Treponema sp. J25]|uniref:polyprenyl diphosphate synthase n=1 Tax=Treponema sp. J25 TaxID=2094121 RepID=UPI0010485408|nr:polyprenyl diphosphate synthase [Treponema sp. J25]TCW60782.1 di-trans,poly-cis-decaprenylcistransferase [Treponema sp. J25]